MHLHPLSSKASNSRLTAEGSFILLSLFACISSLLAKNGGLHMLKANLVSGGTKFLLSNSSRGNSRLLSELWNICAWDCRLFLCTLSLAHLTLTSSISKRTQTEQQFSSSYMSLHLVRKCPITCSYEFPCFVGRTS